MADALDQMLAPGEEVLRSDGRRLRQIAFNCLAYALGLSFVGVIFGALWFLAPDRPLLLYIGLGMFGVGAICLVCWLIHRGKPRRPEAALTETRVLYWNDATAPEAGEILFGDIAAIEPAPCGGPGLKIVKRDGAAVTLPDMVDSDSFAEVLTVAAELARPLPHWKLNAMDRECLDIATIAGPLSIALLMFSHAVMNGATLWSLLLLGLLAIPSYTAAFHLARLTTFLRHWRRYSPETIRAWLKPRPYETALDRWHIQSILLNPLYRRLANSLYGAAVWPGVAGEARHG